ncbi:MAG: hypothetical protein LBU39_00580 [Desulfobulbaceae bacterium]|jgi:hypothetical protein|nr:hypothetical protein [Desulfobulbaceae bacterium]
MKHDYPQELARYLRGRWPGKESLPSDDVLFELLSTCYQVSLLREEGRAIRLRLMLAEPELFAGNRDAVLGGLFTLRFSEPRPFKEYEMLKLGPSIDYNNTMLGVCHSEGEGLRIWGLVHTGSRWVQAIHGGSKRAMPLPPALGVNVIAPGALSVLRGFDILGQLIGGRIISPSLGVFRSDWVATRFSAVQTRLASMHADEFRQGEWARIDPAFIGRLYLEVIKHVISTIRRSGHGGTILSFPAEAGPLLHGGNPFISLKYRFMAGDARMRLRGLLLEIMRVLAALCGQRHGPDYVAGWNDYVSLQDKRLNQLDEQVFKYARFLARLSGADGAIVTTEAPELVGFGGIIEGTYEMGEHIARAFDPEGKNRVIERVESVGTRHRSLYYLARKMPSVLGIVVSQDARVRVVTWGGDTVLCWDVIPIDFT